MKTAVSIPDDVFRDADLAANDLGWSRSQLYTRALQTFLANHGDDPVTDALDALADELTSQQTPNPGRSMIDSGTWDW